MALREAKKWRVPPTTFIAGRRAGWKPEDSFLALGLAQYEADRVDHLGLPVRDTEEGDPEGHWEARTKFNAAQQALDLARKDQADKALPGDVVYLVDTRKETL